LLRTAASLVAALATQPPKGLLNKTDLAGSTLHGALLVAGSYVPKTTQQLEHLIAHTAIHPIEIKVNRILDGTLDARKISEECSRLLTQGRDVCLYTSRELVADHGQKKNLAIGHQVSAFLCTIVKILSARPNYILAKGGITSSDIATESLGVKRALVMGQILPGIPVWKLGEETPFPGLPYIVFPGNVGGVDAISSVVNNLRATV
jgi:uncharacterized protein YgbK (DUF1537 family)